jgi:putative xylitol transport system substrate-binding protein
MKTKVNIMAAMAITLSGLSSASAETYNITAMPFGLSEYMANWVQALEDHPAVMDGTVTLTVLDGRFDASVQSNQIDTVITRHADAVIFAPIDGAALAASVDRAAAAGIPVIASVTSADTDTMTTYFGSNDVQGGRLLGETMVKMLEGKGNVVILEGPIGNSPQILRRQGIDEVLAENPDIKVLASKTANWSRAEGLAVMENWLSAYGDGIDGVIAQNDEMGLGAIQAIEARGMTTDDIHVVSLDGIQDGLRAVRDKGLVTFFKDPLYPAQGGLDLALRTIIGPDYEPRSKIWSIDVDWQDGTADYYENPWRSVTKENVDEFLHE